MELNFKYGYIDYETLAYVSYSSHCVVYYVLLSMLRLTAAIMRRLGTVRAVPESASAAHSAAVDHASLKRAVATSAVCCML